MKIFLSHAHEDKKIVEAFSTQLGTIGAETILYTYNLNPAMTVIEKVKEGIRNCDMGIILWTRNSSGKEWIIQEAGALSILNKPSVVFLEPGLDPPGGMIQGIHYIKTNDPEGMQNLGNYVSNEVSNERFRNTLLWGGLGLGLLFLLFKS